MRAFFLSAVSLLFLLNSGCFLGTFQTAQTVPPGEVNYGFYADMPVYFNKSDKDASKDKGLGAFVTPNVGGYLIYGASPGLNFGLRGSLGEGIGPFAKFRFLDESVMPLSGAATFTIGYHPVAQGISLRSDLIFSKMLSSYSSIYFGWTFLRSPDYRKLANKDIKIEDVQEFKYFHSLFVGVDLKRRPDENDELGWVPFGLTIELAVPLVKYPALFFGFQLKR